MGKTKNVDLDSFYAMFGHGFRFVYNEADQCNIGHERQAYITEDKRVFDEILIAHNPGCIRFKNSCGCVMQIDGVDRINIKNKDDVSGCVFLDVLCSANGIDSAKFSFIAKGGVG